MAASCSDVVPNSCMCRIATIAYMFAMVGPYGISNCTSGMVWLCTRGAVPVAWPSERGRPASVMSATSHLPAAIACAACDTWDDIGRAAGVGRVDMAERQAEIFRHRERSQARGIAGAEIAIDIAVAEPGIFERAFRDVHVQLRHRGVGRLAQRMLVDAGDAGLVPDAHASGSLPLSRSCRAGSGRVNDHQGGASGTSLPEQHHLF